MITSNPQGYLYYLAPEESGLNKFCYFFIDFELLRYYVYISDNKEIANGIDDAEDKLLHNSFTGARFCFDFHGDTLSEPMQRIIACTIQQMHSAAVEKIIDEIEQNGELVANPSQFIKILKSYGNEFITKKRVL